MKFKTIAALAALIPAISAVGVQAKQTAPYYGPNFQVSVHCKDGVLLTSRYSDFPALCAAHGGTRYPAPYVDPVGTRPRVQPGVKATAGPKAIPTQTPGCGTPANGIQDQNNC